MVAARIANLRLGDNQHSQICEPTTQSEAAERLNVSERSLNLRRRHLDESQRAMVGARVANLRRGDNQHTPIGGTSISQSDAAERLNVGVRSVQRATEVLDHGTAELVRAVERGAVAVSTAAEIQDLEVVLVVLGPEQCSTWQGTPSGLSLNCPYGERTLCNLCSLYKGERVRFSEGFW
jgi:hypothetical protein